MKNRETPPLCPVCLLDKKHIIPRVVVCLVEGLDGTKVLLTQCDNCNRVDTHRVEGTGKNPPMKLPDRFKPKENDINGTSGSDSGNLPNRTHDLPSL